MGFLSVPNLIPWLIFGAWIVPEQFCWITLHFNLAGRGSKGWRGAAIIRGRRLLFPSKGGDYSRDVINRGTAIVRGNTVYPSNISSSRNASFPFETYLNILLSLFCPKTNIEKIPSFWPKSRAKALPHWRREKMNPDIRKIDILCNVTNKKFARHFENHRCMAWRHTGSDQWTNVYLRDGPSLLIKG